MVSVRNGNRHCNWQRRDRTCRRGRRARLVPRRSVRQRGGDKRYCCNRCGCSRRPATPSFHQNPALMGWRLRREVCVGAGVASEAQEARKRATSKNSFVCLISTPCEREMVSENALLGVFNHPISVSGYSSIPLPFYRLSQRREAVLRCLIEYRKSLFQRVRQQLF